MAIAIHRSGELGGDARVEGGVVGDEGPHEGLYSAHELAEHQVLVLHLVDEARGLQEPLAVPVSGRRVRRAPVAVGEECAGRGARLVGGDEGLDLVDESVVLAVEHGVDAGQPDVLVASAVTGDEVLPQRRGVVRGHPRRAVPGPLRSRAVGDVVEEGVAGALHGVDRAAHLGHVHGAQGARRVALGEASVGEDEERESVGATKEATVLVGGHERHVGDVVVSEGDAQLGARLCLDLGPCGDALGRRAVEQRSGRHRPAGRGALRSRGAVGNRPAAVGAQEDLVRRVRRVRLVLVDPGRGGVGAGVVAVEHRAVERHEVGRRARHVERVVLLERDEHDLRAGLAHEVEPVVEELAEEREHAARGRANPRVGRRVQDRELRVRLLRGVEPADVHARGLHRGGVRRGLVDHEVADDPRLGVDDIARAQCRAVSGRHRTEGRRGHIGAAPTLRGEAGERLIGRSPRRVTALRRVGHAVPLGEAGGEIVVAPVHLTQAQHQPRVRDVGGTRRPGHIDVGAPDGAVGHGETASEGAVRAVTSAVRLRDLDLLQDELHVAHGEVEACLHGRCRRAPRSTQETGDYRGCCERDEQAAWGIHSGISSG